MTPVGVYDGRLSGHDVTPDQTDKLVVCTETVILGWDQVDHTLTLGAVLLVVLSQTVGVYPADVYCDGIFSPPWTLRRRLC